MKPMYVSEGLALVDSDGLVREVTRKKEKG